MTDRHFEYDLDSRYMAIWLPFGVRKGQGVTIGDDTFTATYGWAKLTTPLSNIKGGHITENYRWWTSVGIRLSFADSGLTFGTNNKRGVCIHFDQKVGGVVPGRSHRALTVTVDDCEGLVDAIGLDEP